MPICYIILIKYIDFWLHIQTVSENHFWKPYITVGLLAISSSDLYMLVSHIDMIGIYVPDKHIIFM